MVCWSPRSEDCNIVTASAGQLRQSYVKVDVPSFSELGRTLRTDLLAPRVITLDDAVLSPQHIDEPARGAQRPIADLGDAGQQITAASGAGSGPDPDQQVADLGQSEQGARYGWLLWTGAALLVAGLALGAALRVKARGS